MSTEKKTLEDRLDSLSKKLDEMADVRSPFYGGYSAASRDDEIDLRELWGVIWRGKWIIVGVTLIFALISVVYALSLPNIYKSEALLAPAEENSGAGLAGMTGQLGGLASLAGVNLGGGSDKTVLAIEVLKSREFISKFIKKHELLVPLIAVKGWDRSSDKLIIDSDIYDLKNASWVRGPELQGGEPTMQEAYKVFAERFVVTQNKKSNFVTVSVDHFSPNIAKQWVDWLVEDINVELKSRDVTEAKKSVEYLTNQLVKTSISDMRSIFYELIEEQTKIIMFAEVRYEYAFKTIDSAVAAEKKSRPNRAKIVLTICFLGAVLGCFFVLIREKLAVDH